MMQRKRFIQSAASLGAGLLFGRDLLAMDFQDFTSQRPAPADRRFNSEAVEAVIVRMKSLIADRRLAWLFENCFPNTLDTTVDFSTLNGRPDTYVITGDIDAMWLRDSTAQVWPYLSLIGRDKKLQDMVAGVINRQTACILLDPYANAFYKDPSRVSEWKATDITDMRPGIHERKWEIDSLCYPVRLAYAYWQAAKNNSVFDASWKEAINLIVNTFTEQQRKEGRGPYSFQRKTSWATDGVPLEGYGYPVNPVGLICSMFRPSDDATIFPFLVPSNFFAAKSLRQAAEMVLSIHGDEKLAGRCLALAAEIEQALKKYGRTTHPQFGEVYAYEVNGLGSYNLMDDANVPSLLSLPYLGVMDQADPVYQATRKLLLSSWNPFFFKGSAGEGIGSPHTGIHRIWPISIMVRALTSADPGEISDCIRILVRSGAGTGFMHESFQQDDPSKFTRAWFAWANTLFGELIMKAGDHYPSLLKLRYS